MGALKQPTIGTGNPSFGREGSVHHSLALKHAIRRFRTLGGARVLDLGPAVGRNVQFLSPFIDKLFIADLTGTISTQAGRSALDRSRLDRILRRDLPISNPRSIDLILAWDLLNYLDRDQVTTLGRHLDKLCHRDSLLFVLISNKTEVPELPGRYLILDAETLRYENTSTRSRMNPGYREPDLDRLLPAFEVETSFLLRSGVQEYVMTTRSLG